MEYKFWKNVVLFTLFFVTTPITILTAIFSLSLYSPNKDTVSLPVNANKLSEAYGVSVFASLPATTPTVSGVVTSGDARPEMVRQYLEFYDSSLEPYSGVLVEAADKYGLDFRLLPAIAQQESNLCKWIPEGGHNCWGWGIHKEGTLGFSSYEEAIWTVAKGLKEEYIDKGYTTPELIMSKYTPLSKGSWAAGVTEFMSELQ